MPYDFVEKKKLTKQAKKRIQELRPQRKKIFEEYVLSKMSEFNRKRSEETGVFYLNKRFGRNNEGLTDKQIRFIEEYLVDLNAKRAAKVAGYSDSSAKSVYTALLGRPHVEEAIRKRKLKISEKMEMTREDILNQYRSIAEADYGDYIEYDEDGAVTFKPYEELTLEQRAAIADVCFFTDPKTGVKSISKIKLHDKTKALEALSKYHGMFEKDNKQKSSGVNINIDTVLAEIESANPELGEIVRTKLAKEIKQKEASNMRKFLN